MPVIPIIMNSNMQERLKNIRIVFIALLVTAALAAAADGLYFSGLEWRIRTARADAKLSSLEKEAETLLARTEKAVIETGDPASLFRNTLGSVALKKGITLIVYRDGRAAYWSDNSIAFPVIYEQGFDEHKPVFYSNGWFVPVHREFPGYELLALIKVYKQYPIVNDILKSGFNGIFPLPEETLITFEEEDSAYKVLGSENEFHFGLVFPERKPNTVMLILPVLLWLAVIFLLVRLVVLSSGWIDKRTGRGAGMPVAFAILIVIYAVILLTGLPPSVESTELFSPFHWSAGRLMPTVGHALLLGLLILSGIRLIFRNGKFNEPWAGEGLMRYAVPGSVMLAGFILFLAAEACFRDLVLNSAISFEAFRILDMTFMSLAGFVSVMILMTVPVILFMRASRMMREWTVAESGGDRRNCPGLATDMPA
jgi:hypothetical protein